METAPNEAATRPRLDSLTGLRFLAALAVFGYHLIVGVPTTQYSPIYHVFLPGPTGVSFFFILSGFVLTWSHRQGDRPVSFLRRRLARIYPLHVLTWAAAGVIAAVLFGLPAKLPALASLVLLSTWIPSAHFYNAMNIPSWSLGCEFFFYALFPLLHPRLSSIGSRNRRLLILGAIACTALIAMGCTAATRGSFGVWVIYQFPPTRLLEFVAGMALAMEVAEHRIPRIPLSMAALFAAGVYVAAGYAPLDYGLVSVTFLPFVVLIASAAQADVARFRSLLATPILVRLGVWSFAFYLVHVEVLTIVVHDDLRSAHSALGASILAVAALVASVLVAAIASTFVEQPLERLLRAPGRRRVRATAERLTADVP